MRRVLHLLSQRPSLTGSGVTLEQLVRHAGAAGWEQWVVFGTNVADPPADVGNLPPDRLWPLKFGTPPLDFPIPGMSDVMPYPSTVFSALREQQLSAYRDSWRRHLEQVLPRCQPDLVHAHHVWILSAMLKDVAPDLPVVVQCHATGLRQMALCPHLARQVCRDSARNDQFTVLHRGHAEALSCVLGISGQRIRLVGAGYDEALFHPGARAPQPNSLLYVGKLSAAKGLPWLLDVVQRLASRHADLLLHVAGSGAGPEAAALLRRIGAMGRLVRYHGHLPQQTLSELMRRTQICVLPSFYEGVPLVLAEALACGCRLVSTALPGVLDQLAGPLRSTLELVPLPRLVHTDQPDPRDLTVFVDELTAAVDRALSSPPLDESMVHQALAPFTWQAVFERVQQCWLDSLAH